MDQGTQDAAQFEQHRNAVAAERLRGQGPQLDEEKARAWEADQRRSAAAAGVPVEAHPNAELSAAE